LRPNLPIFKVLMKVKNYIIIPSCLSFRHFFAVLSCVTSLSLMARGPALEVQKTSSEMSVLRKYGLSYKVNTRNPGNYVPHDEFLETPFTPKHWGESILVEDNRGVLVSIKNQLNDWREKEEYAQKWNLESTGLYWTPEREEKQKYLEKSMLRYADKRLSGEIKNAPSGSTLHKIGKVQKALKPAAKINIAPQTKFRLKARILQRHARASIENPYVDSEFNYYLADDSMNAKIGKRNDDWGINTYFNYDITKEEYWYDFSKDFFSTGISTSMSYEFTKERYSTTISKQLNPQWSTDLTSKQSTEEIAYSEDSERILKVKYRLNF
jgi:hypothetical protein